MLFDAKSVCQFFSEVEPGTFLSLFAMCTFCVTEPICTTAFQACLLSARHLLVMSLSSLYSCLKMSVKTWQFLHISHLNIF